MSRRRHLSALWHHNRGLLSRFSHGKRAAPDCGDNLAYLMVEVGGSHEPERFGLELRCRSHQGEFVAKGLEGILWDGPGPTGRHQVCCALAMGRKERPTVQVTIVAASEETLDNLQTYLSLAGLGPRGTRHLGDVGREPCAAIVFFPDEFLPADVLEELMRLRRDRPTILPWLVTREPLRYLQGGILSH